MCSWSEGWLRLPPQCARAVRRTRNLILNYKRLCCVRLCVLDLGTSIFHFGRHHQEGTKMIESDLLVFDLTMHQEKYSLKWHTYSDRLRNVMKEMMMNEDLFDVTLVTEDKKQVKAHINILSTCSPVFKDILKKDKSKSPVINLRGIQYSEMEPIMQFIYLGEATFYEANLEKFIAIAKSLKIKELCNAETKELYRVKDESSPSYLELKTEETEKQTVNAQTKEYYEEEDKPSTSFTSTNVKLRLRFDVHLTFT